MREGEREEGGERLRRERECEEREKVRREIGQVRRADGGDSRYGRGGVDNTVIREAEGRVKYKAVWYKKKVIMI